MASVKVKFRPSSVVGHEGIVYYQIIHERKVRQLRTEYKVLASEWNENRSTVTTTLHSERKGYILSIREKIRLDIERLTKIVHRLDASGLLFIPPMMSSTSSAATNWNTLCSVSWKPS